MGPTEGNTTQIQQLLDRAAEGNDDAYVPRIQAQHYKYLVRQFEWIRDGKRRNANLEMVEQIQSFEQRAIHATLDYVSRLKPPLELQAPPGWKNPDFGCTDDQVGVIVEVLREAQ